MKNQRAVRNLTQPIRFQGQWHDEESGLYYNRHRYYDPQQGRYISQDPIGLSGGTNLYGYVTNPTGMVDPRGLYGVLGADFSDLTGSTNSCSPRESLWDRFLESAKNAPSPLNRSTEPLHNKRVDGLPESMRGEMIGLPEDNSFRENQELIYNTAIPSAIGTDAGIVTGAIGYGGKHLGFTGNIIKGNAIASLGLWSTTGGAYIQSHIFALIASKGVVHPASIEGESEQ